MDNQNIFLKHKFWVLSFIITFFVFLYLYFKNSLGLFFDIPAMFLNLFQSIDINENHFMVLNDDRPRFFCNLLVAIPFNIGYFFIKKLPVINSLSLFSASYFIVHMFTLLINYLISLRTKRFDIAVISFVFYAIFSIPNAIWACRELHIAVLFYFALLQYFLSKEKLNVWDLIPVGLLIILMFETFETVFLFGIILFIFMCLYSKKENVQNIWFKILIGISVMIAGLCVPIKLFILQLQNSLTISGGFQEWLSASFVTLNWLLQSNTLISVAAVITVIFLIFYKNNILKSWGLVFLSVLIAALGYFLYIKTGFNPEPKVEMQNYSIVMWFIFPVLISILVFDFIEPKSEKVNTYFISNLLIIGCLFGIFNLIWQIHSCIEFGKYKNHLKNLIKNAETTFIEIPQEDLNWENVYMRYASCYGISFSSVLLSEDSYIKHVIVPSDYYIDYNEFCFSGPEYNYYDKNKKLTYIQKGFLKNTYYWDLTEINKEYEKLGRVK